MLLLLSLVVSVGAGLVVHRETAINATAFRTQLVYGPLLPGSPPNFELDAAHRSLLLLKDSLGPQGVIDLIEPNTTAAAASWHQILANSTNCTHILSEARLRAYNTVYNASTFIAWFGANTGPNKLISAHPEHYSDMAIVDPITGASGVEIYEAMGPLLTHYRIPSYADGGPKKPWFRALPEFPIQFTGEATLQDGTDAVIGDIHNSFRDLQVGEVEVGSLGVEAVLAVWYPDGTPDDVVEEMREHQSVEFSNWLAAAQSDIVNGVFKV